MSDNRFASAWASLLGAARENPGAVHDIHDALTSFLSTLAGVTTYDPSQSRSVNELERRRIEARLADFDPNQSHAWADIQSRFGDSLNQAELRSLAEVIGFEIGVKVDREAKRRKEVLIKWFDENYPLMEAVLSRIEMEDSNGKQMSGDA